MREVELDILDRIAKSANMKLNEKMREFGRNRYMYLSMVGNTFK